MAIRFSAMVLGVGMMAAVCPLARGAERVTLKNGFEVDCARREVMGDKVRLYFAGKGGSTTADGANHGATVDGANHGTTADGASYGTAANGGTVDGANYMDVSADSVVRVETVADVAEPVAAKAPASPARLGAQAPTREEMHVMLAQAGAAHHIDEDLLASVVRAESAGQVRAVSRTGAKGLMQLMPGTASAMGVEDAFQPEQNIAGGTAYLDALLIRYHDNVALALAAYNAGPMAVDRYHGVPPYRETREYVARVIREFNRRKQMMQVAQGQ